MYVYWYIYVYTKYKPLIHGYPKNYMVRSTDKFNAREIKICVMKSISVSYFRTNYIQHYPHEQTFTYIHNLCK